MPLNRSQAIVSSILSADTPTAGTIDKDLDDAFETGVSVGGVDPAAIPPFSGYGDFSAAIKVAVRQSYAGVLAAMAPSPWQALPLAGSWVAEPGFQEPQYRKEGVDLVRLRGAVQSGGALLATLPAGFRPPAKIRVSVANGSTTSPGYLDIAANGQITVVQATNTIVSLDGICFSVSD